MKRRILFVFLSMLCLSAPGRTDVVGDKGPDNGPIDNRVQQERSSLLDPFVITPHKPTYILPISYNSSPNREPYASLADEGDIDRTEIDFQVSLKFLVWPNIFEDNGHLFLAYSQKSFWQAYNSELSAPFRETNHEPEAFIVFRTNYDFLGFKNKLLWLGIVHQSNGRRGTISRSWNRVYANFFLERDRWLVSFKPWYRIPEEKEDDNNPDIDEYLGSSELMIMRPIGLHTLAALLRNNLDSPNRGAVQLDWTFPIAHQRLKGYVQYFNGYGDSLIDYNHRSNRLGLGIMLTNWF